jgi:hypothetical protein
MAFVVPNKQACRYMAAVSCILLSRTCILRRTETRPEITTKCLRIHSKVKGKVLVVPAHDMMAYEVESKIFRTGAAIYTAVVVARSTVPNRPNCEFGFYCDVLWRLRENVGRRRPDFGGNITGCFIMTTPRLTLPSSPSSFWRNIKWLSSPTHRTPLIWHPVTSYYFQKLN